MRLSESASVSSSSKIRNSHSVSRSRKKHKKLDAICEKAYNRNRGVEDESKDVSGGGGADSELRRSTRVRRAPVLLDASPQAKKRRKFDKTGGALNGKRDDKGKEEGRSCEDFGDMEEESSWKSRLRSRVRNVSLGKKGGKRKLFGDLNVVKEEIDLEKRELGGEEEGLEGGKLRIVKSKRPDGIKASRVLLEVEKDIEASTLEEADNDRIEVEMSGKDDKEDILDLEGGNEGETVNGNALGLVEKVESEYPNGLSMEDCIGSENVEIVKQIDEVPAQLESVEERENQGDTLEAGEITTNQPERGSCDGDAPVVMLGEKPLENENDMKVNKSNRDSADKLGRPRIKEGRRCGLCGGGTDGKPPNRLVHDMAESENEACSGSSVSEEPNYDIWDGFGDEPGWLGRLLGPINDRFGIAGIWVHQHCAVWSPEVYFAGLGCLKNVRAALCRGKALKCSRCGRRGATIGCRVDRCPKTYHLPCARADGCIFDHRKFLIACTDHRHLFQPQGDQYLYRIKKLKAKKMKLEIRKLSNDALQKDVEAEEKWLENCGEDEEFLKRESKRLHRDILRIAPVYIGGSESETGKLFQGWESVAGLQDVIRCMKEVVILPLLYPEFFTSLGLTPPRGVLLHGHPGTGKTLVVRALIGSCARGDKRIAYFARKGADCLGKYVGDAERQLRLLFQVAERCQPSIIFFDEIDGLAPQRTRQQDQTHSSVVSTLLALLDGLKSRGSVVVIGATNRPDALDPALRRPGRFDREIYFPLPSLKDRAAILSLHTQRWPKPVSGPLLQWIARRTADFAGADLQALCTQAAITALKRNFPLQNLLSAAGEKGPDRNCVPLPTFAVEERDWLEALSSSPPPCSRREAGIAANDMVSSPLAEHLISCLLQPLSILLVALYLDDRLWLPPPISKAATKIKNVIVSALDKNNVPSDSWWAHVKSLLEEPDVAKKIEREISSVGILTRDATFAGSDLLNDDIAEGSEMFKFSKVHDGYRSSLLRNTSYALGKNPGFRILIAGSPRSGQRHLASCILHCFVGNFQIQKVDLATISQEGRGDVMQGLTQILMKCSSMGSCVLFMPRIDLWAIDAHHQVDKMETDSCSRNNKPYGEESHMECSHGLGKANGCCLITCESAEEATDEDSVQSASLAWSSFIEQVDSICMSTSLMIMATSEVPYQEVPIRIRQFFNNDISNYSDSTPGHTVPQFSVQVDGNYNNDVVITSSATKLSRDVAQQFVQLIHQTTHSINTTEHDADVVCHSTDHGSANQNKVVTQPSEDSLVKVPLAANNRVDKGKSSLLLAISTFGYQILRFPHFAELCWVTSKLKDGPWADINGPWKGWPFNSCVVRPNFSLEKVAGDCSSSIMKSKEKASVVRGLVAVGLSAYRGVYASLREVSLEVRKVLELLVGQINAKILAGKDQYQFVRILSQVAYLEDVVDSWAHTLQRLEPDGHVTGANLQPSCVRSPVDDNIGAEELVCKEQSKQNVSSRSSHELDGPSGNPHKSSGENGECIYLNDVSGCVSYPNSIGRVAMPEEGPLKQMVHSGPNTHLQNSTAAADGLDGKILNQQNGTNSESSFSENTGNQTTENGDYGSLKCSNEFAYRESADGPASSGDQVGVRQSDSIKVCNQGNGFSLETCSNSVDANSKPNEGFVFSNKTTGLSADRQIVCMYSCCSECLRALHSLMQKIVMHEWGLNGSYKTVEDIHDIVESLSTSLLLALRRDYGAESFRTSFDKKPRHENHSKLFEHKKIGACLCKNSEIISVMPMNCSCHSVTESLMDNGCTSPNPQVELATNFIYRDGVLVPVDSNQDAFVHCKFEALCLCSLVEWIAMTKQYLD